MGNFCLLNEDEVWRNIKEYRETRKDEDVIPLEDVLAHLKNIGCKFVFGSIQ